MLLTHDQIKSITRGAVAFEPDGEALHLHRCTATQRETYRAAGEGYYNRACCTAGVRFDFRTDATSLAMSWRYGPRSSRNYLSVDCYVDGVLIDAFLDSSFVDDAGNSCSFALPAGDKRVTIHLPYTVELIPTRVELSDGASITPVVPAKRILMIGDSITHGYDAKYTSQSYAMNVARYFDWDVINHGIAAYIHDANTIENLPDWKPDIITTAYGTNDWSKAKSVEEYDAPVRAFFTRLREVWPDTPILGILPVWRADFAKPRPSGSFDEMRARLAQIELSFPNVCVLDGMDAVPHNRSFYGDLRVHPNDMGFAHYAMAVIREIEKMI